jgi:hypothetical protein
MAAVAAVLRQRSTLDRQRVDGALELLTEGLRPYFEREMKSVYGANWQRAHLQSIYAEGEVDPEATIREFRIVRRATSSSRYSRRFLSAADPCPVSTAPFAV